jgi:hypothetical protein
MARTFKVMLVALVILVLAGSAYAFAASLTINGSTSVGTGQSVVNGFTVSNIVYHLGADKMKVESITFDIAGTTDPDVVQIQTVTGGTWKTDCTLGTKDVTTPVTCTYETPFLDLSAVTALNVYAIGGN